ncbi:MAG: AI-2E family transporter [Ignavibacteriaceae bacterium]|nr:AI-2E family transporter [Ignavibacteriaceae bacterium]
MTNRNPSTDAREGLTAGIHPLVGALLAGVLALIIWSLFRSLGMLVPIVAAATLLWPQRRQAWARSLLWLLALLAVIWILHKARMVVYPLLAGLLIAYWLDPIVDRLERRRIKRRIGSLIALLPALVVGLLVVIFALPLLIEQLGLLIAALPRIYDSVCETLRPWVEAVIPSEGAARWKEILVPAGAHIETIVRGLWGGASGLGRGIGTLAGFLGMLVLAPILAYYLLVDFDRVRTLLPALVPEQKRAWVSEVVSVFEQTVSSYFRGQVLVAICVMILFTAGFLLIRLPHAVILGVLAGLLNLVPVIGFWTSAALCAAAALLSGEPGPMLLKLAIVLSLEQVLEAQVLTPRIVGRAVGLNPVIVLLSVLVCGAVLGPLGLILAVPAAAFGWRLLRRRAPLSGAHFAGPQPPFPRSESPPRRSPGDP